MLLTRIEVDLTVADVKDAGSKDPIYIGVVFPQVTSHPDLDEQLYGGGREWNIATRRSEPHARGTSHWVRFAINETVLNQGGGVGSPAEFGVFDTELHVMSACPPQVYVRKGAPGPDDDMLLLAGCAVRLVGGSEPNLGAGSGVHAYQLRKKNPVRLSVESGLTVWLTRVI